MQRMHAAARVGIRLKRGIPIRVIDVDGTHRNAMFAQIAYDLRRRVKSHWLRIEQGGCKYVRVAAFQPGRSIDEERKACRMTFRKAVFAEALDLAKAAFGELAWIISCDHSLDHLRLEHADGTAAFE